MTKKTEEKDKEKTVKLPVKKVPAKVGDETKTAKGAKSEGAPEKAKKPEAPKTVRKPLLPRTTFAKQGTLTRWRMVDATGVPLGRLSSWLAMALMGKDKAGYTRSSDTGDSIIVINAQHVKLTGNKLHAKVYNYHTGYPGGIKTLTAKNMMEKNPEELITRAVHGMLPDGHMGRRWEKKLHVFAGADHPHKAQQPELVKLPNLGTWE